MLKHFYRGLFIATLLCITLLASACASELFQDVQALMPLREQLAQTYHEDEINLQIQNGHDDQRIFYQLGVQRLAAGR